MTENQLTEQLHRLADTIEAPPALAAADITRGRSRRRRRRTTLAGAALALAVTGGLAWSAVGTDDPPVAGPAQDERVAPPVGAPRDLPGTAPKGAASDLEARIRELAAEPGNRDDQLPRFTLRRMQAVVDVLRERIATPLGWTSITSATSWTAAGVDTCPAGWSCEDARVRGADRARWAESGAVHQLAVDFDGEVHVFTVSDDDARPAELAWEDGRP